MNVCVFYYDGFCEFEVVLAVSLFKNSFISAALEKRVYVSEEKQKFVPDKAIKELNPEEIDLFIIPGGDPEHLYGNKELIEFIKVLNEKNKFIAGICGGTELMAKCGVLNDRKCTGDSEGIRLNERNKDIFENTIIIDEDVVIDGNCITSMGKAYVEFSLELGKLMKVYKNDEEVKKDYKWLKNIKEIG